jgi:hypothetical protein
VPGARQRLTVPDRRGRSTPDVLHTGRKFWRFREGAQAPFTHWKQPSG